MAPFLPFSAAKCAEMLGLRQPGQECSPCNGAQMPLPWDEATRELPPGHVLGEPVILFKKLEAAELFGDHAA